MCITVVIANDIDSDISPHYAMMHNTFLYNVQLNLFKILKLFIHIQVSFKDTFFQFERPIEKCI